MYFNDIVECFDWLIVFMGNLFASGGAKDEDKEDGGDEVVMNNLMHDIKEGFIQRRLPDGGFKVGLIWQLANQVKR